MADRGTEQSRSERRRAERRKRGGLQALVALVAAVALVTIVWASAGGGGSAPSGLAAPEPTESAAPPPPVTLVAGTAKDPSAGDKLVWLDLLSLSSSGKKGAIVYIPAHSVVEVPGRGLQDLADAYSTGGVPLLLTSTENLLGLRIAHYLILSETDSGTLFSSIDPISVDVPAQVEVPAGKDQARVLFRPGLQSLPSAFMTSLLYTVGLDGDDQELGNRNLAFWDALSGAFGSDPGSLVSKISSSGAAIESNTSLRDDARLIAGVVSLPATEHTLAALPVDQVSAGGSEMYRSDSERVASFLGHAVGPVPPPNETASVQVLNGNGVPGIGKKVSTILIEHGFRVVLSGNAPNFPHYRRSLIVMYGTSGHDRALAEQVRRLLGVGEIQESAQRQGIVELTIVVGKDFLGSH